MIFFTFNTWRQIYNILSQRLCLFFIIEYCFLFYFLNSLFRIIDYFFFNYHYYKYFFFSAGVTLLVVYPLTYFYSKFQIIVIDNLLKLLFNRYFLMYVKFTANFIKVFSNRYPKTLIVLMNAYFMFFLLYYTDVVWFNFSINMDLTIAYYYLFYTIRTFIFLPNFIIGVITNHPKADDLFEDFFKRNPQYLSIINELFGNNLRGMARVVGEQMQQVLQNNPNVGPAAAVIGVLGYGAGTAAHGHSQHQQDRIRVITEDENTFRKKMVEKSPASLSTPETFAAQGEMAKAGTAAKINTDTGPAAVKDTIWSLWKGKRDSVGEYKDRADKSIDALTKAASENPPVMESVPKSSLLETPPVNSIKELSFVDLYLEIIRFFKKIATLII